VALVAAAVCPHPPLLVPAVASGAAAELDDLRSVCRGACEGLWEAAPDRVFVVGADDGTRAMTFGPWASAAPDLPALDVPEPLPLSLLVGAWLTTGTPRSFVVVDPELDADDCASLGRDLADAAPRVAVLAMGDGSARHDLKAPGYLDPRAAAYDDEVGRALASADVEALLRLGVEESAALLVIGRPVWQVLAGAATGGAFDVAASTFAAPYGVGYHVATWKAADG
jgi:hypothetical protein